MKKILLLCMLTVLYLSSVSQTIVSTTLENKRAVVEDYSGVMWETPYTHKRIQHQQYKYPENVFTIFIHEGDNAIPGSDDYLDLRTQWGPALMAQTDFNPDLFTTTVNRHVFPDYAHFAGTAIGANSIIDAINLIIGELAYVNVAAEAELDMETNLLTVHVEAYYTGNSPEPTNYLNVALVQNDIYGWQVGRLRNPNYCTSEDEEYRQQSVLRHLLTDQFGEAITNTTVNSFIDRTYTFVIPDEIEDIEVDITNLEIVVFVAESTQEIINGNVCIPELTGAPIIKIEASMLGVCEGETIKFTDASLSGVTSRIWSFPGGNPSSSTEISPVVVYANAGDYDVTLSVTNVHGTTEQTYTNYVKVGVSSDTYCLDFEGWEATHWVNAPYASSLIAGTDQFSMTCWVFPRFYVDDWTHFGGIIGFRELIGGMDFYILQLYGTKLEARIVTSDDMFTLETVDGTLELYEYQHLALTYDGSHLKLYKNAELIGETEATGLYGTNGNVGLNIGGTLLGNYTWTFDGEVDEVTLWTKALTEEEIDQYICIEEDPTAIDGLALYYDFSECGGTIVDDKVGYYQGTMQNITDDNRVSTVVCEYTDVDEDAFDENVFDEVVVYPNPINNVLHITNCEGATLEIINVMGQVVMTKTDVNGTIDVSSVPNGFYLVKVTGEKSQIVRKINIRE
jgi:PKD repeat protein